jgi:beta-lactam-binding protein with PASTA domain
LSDTKKGIKVPQGSEIEAIVSTRGTGSAPIPNLRCKTIEEAKFMIEASQLAVGTVVGDDTWQEGQVGYVYFQIPRYIEGNTLELGTSVDIKVTKFPPTGCR